MDLCLGPLQGQLSLQEGSLPQCRGISPALRVREAGGHAGAPGPTSEACSLVLGQGVVTLQVVVL